MAVLRHAERHHGAAVGHRDHVRRTASKAACSGHPSPRSTAPGRNADGHGRDLWARPDHPVVCHPRESRLSVSERSSAHRDAMSEPSLVGTGVPDSPNDPRSALSGAVPFGDQDDENQK